MKNNKLLIVLGILTAVTVGYFMFKKKKKQENAPDSQSGEPFIDESTIPPFTTETEDKKDSPVARAGAAVGAVISGLFSTNTAGYSDYVVITNSSNLNVRKSPSTSATIMGTVAKNAKIKAKPSSSKDWFEYSKDGKTVTGYVSAAYLKKI